MKFKKPKTILFIIIMISIGLIFGTYLPRTIIKISPEDVSYIHIFSGSTGKYIDVSDSKDISHIVTNLSDCKFNKGKSSLFRMGYGYSLTIYNKNEKMYKELILNSPNTIRYNGFFFTTEDNLIDIDYIDSLFSNVNNTP